MKIELTERLLREAKRYELRASCNHCMYHTAQGCLFGWPDRGQSVDVANLEQVADIDVEFCKEFELR